MELLKNFFRNVEKKKLNEQEVIFSPETIRRLQYLKAFNKNINTSPIQLNQGMSYIINGVFYVKRSEQVNLDYINEKTKNIFNHISRVQKDGTIYQESLITLRDYVNMFGPDLEIFRRIIQKTSELNELGFLHRNLNEDNITIDKNLKIRFSGLDKLYFLGLKTPNKIPDKVYKNKEVLFVRTNAEENYSYDMYILAKMFYRIVINTNRTILFTGYYVYSYEDRNDLRKISNEELTKLHDFSPYFLDFLSKTTCKNSKNRLTCRESLEHKFFSGDENCPIKYYNSLLDLDFAPILEKFYINYMDEKFYSKKSYLSYEEFISMFLSRKIIEGKESIDTLFTFSTVVENVIYLFEDEDIYILEVFEDLINHINGNYSNYSKYFVF